MTSRSNGTAGSRHVPVATSALVLCCVVVLVCRPLLAASIDARRPVLYGFTAFPYDLDAEAERRVDEILLPNATLYAVHLDQCLPWAEALDGRPFPPWLEADLKAIRARIPHTHVVYVALTPSATDRRSLAPACSDREGVEAGLPPPLRGKRFDDPSVQRAYLAYARRVIEMLEPKFVNIGIEMSELALRFPGEWPAFETLFRNTYAALKAESPALSIGLEMVLHSLSVPAVASLVKPAVEIADYLGISFYPYTSAYGEHYGARKLPPPPGEWRVLLDWLPTYTDKPIAICETGYSSEPLFIRGGPGFGFTGSPELQDAYLQDLIRIAARDRYLFVVWFILVDYETLLKRLPTAAEYMRIWMYTGLFTPALEPKPAWASWHLWAKQDEHDTGELGAVRDRTIMPLSGRATSAVALADLRCSGASELVHDAEGPSAGARATAWTIHYDTGWELCELPVSVASSARGLEVTMRSDKADAVLLRLQHHSGESFDYYLPVEREWRKVAIPFTLFIVDPKTRRLGRVSPADIAEIVIGEGAGAEGAAGSRTILVSSVSFFE